MGFHSSLIQTSNQSLSVFLSRVNSTYSLPYKNDYCYCIVEGPTDVAFYSQYFNSLYDRIKVIPVEKVDGKMNCKLVKEYLDYFNHTLEAKKHQFLFFIDRDFGSFVSNPNIPSNYGCGIFDVDNNPDNLYVTDYYSIENSIFTKETIKKIYSSDFKKLKIGKDKVDDKEDIVNLIADIYDVQLKKFEKGLVCVTALLIYCQTHNIKYCLPEKVTFSDFIKIEQNGDLLFQYDSILENDENSFDESTFQTKLMDYIISKAKINGLPNRYMNDVEDIKNTLIINNLFCHLFRGHFLEYFWLLFGRCLKRITTNTSQIVTITSEEYTLIQTNLYCAYIESLSKFALRTIGEFAKSIEGSR